MKRRTITIMVSMLVLGALILGACQPVPATTRTTLPAAAPAAQ